MTWDLALQLGKLLQYPGIASLAGGTVCLLFYRDDRRQTLIVITAYIGLCCLIGFNAALLSFLFQVGASSGTGLAGMFDLDMARLLLGFEIGDATLLRLSGFLLPVIACGWFVARLRDRPATPKPFQALTAAYAPTAACVSTPAHACTAVHASTAVHEPTAARPLAEGKAFAVAKAFAAANGLALLLLLASFTVVGHVAVLPPLAQVSIVLHMLAAAVWIGSLPPLLWLCRGSGGDGLATTMKRFGDMAGYCLLVLFAAGLVLALALFHTPGELISTPYGLALLIKLGLVALLLLVAAGNRFLLVPRLLAGADASRLAGAIKVEIAIAAAILIVTSFLATAVGPPAMPM